MSASEFIHPDWIDGYQKVRSWIPWRRSSEESVDEKYLLPSGEALIYDGHYTGSPARRLGPPPSYEHEPEIGAIVEDKHRRLWTITRFVDYNGQSQYDNWEKRTRVYAKRVEA